MAVTGVSGLASGINSSDIVDALVEADRGATKLLENRKGLLNARLEAVRTFNTKLLTAQVDLADLKRPSTFGTRTATSSKPTALTATASSSAASGTYTLTVTDTADAHQIATAGRVSDSAAVGTGSITLRVGSGGDKIIPITGGNSSLQGVARAINGAGAGVTASVINDGTGSPFRLILQSNTTGAASAITVSATDDNGGDGVDLSTLFTGMSTLAAADDAEITLGTGGGALTLTKASNTVSDVIPGVTLNLLDASAGPVSITIGRDTTEAVKEVTGFVDTLNAAITYLGDNTKYDAKTRKGGILLSETGLRRGLTDLTRQFSATDPSLPSGMNSIAALGITLDRTKGTFVVDKAVLSAKLAADPDGVVKLFGNSGSSTVGGIEFAALGDKTVAKNFAVAVTVPATQARATALGAIVADGGGNVVIGAGSKSLSLTINERAYSATLTEGTYTRAQLAAHVQQSVNSQISLSSDRITASLSGNELDLRTAQFGSARSVAVGAGGANTVLNLATTRAVGVDVRGTIDGGAVLTGTGQTLSGSEGTDHDGLRLTVTSAVVTSGTVSARKGVAQVTGEKFSTLTLAGGGVVSGKEDQLEESIADIDAQVKKMDTRLAQRRKRYQNEFLRMEQLISSFQAQGSMLSGQVKGFENAAAARGR